MNKNSMDFVGNRKRQLFIFFFEILDVTLKLGMKLKTEAAFSDT